MPNATPGIKPDGFSELTMQRTETKAPEPENEVHQSNVDGGVE